MVETDWEIIWIPEAIIGMYAKQHGGGGEYSFSGPLKNPFSASDTWKLFASAFLTANA